MRDLKRHRALRFAPVASVTGLERRRAGRGEPAVASRHPSAVTSIRRRLVLAFITVAAAGLIGRAVVLQTEQQGFLQRQANVRHLRVVEIPAHRGAIEDRNGEALAISTPVDSVWAVPRELAAARARWPELVKLLGLDPEWLHRRVARLIDREFVYLRRHVKPEVSRAIRSAEFPGVYLKREYRRYYPTGEIAAHVVGFTDVDDRGQEGMERACDTVLTGKSGAKRVVQDRLGRVVEDVESIATAQPGQDLQLSLDLRIQTSAYRALKRAVRNHEARGGSLVVLDAKTGEVLAMVNQPSYNPNRRAARGGGAARNRAVTDVLEPGSTVKPFTVAAALEAGVVRVDTLLDTSPGFLKVGRHLIRDPRNYGVLDPMGVLVRSSNVGASKIALATPPDDLWGMFEKVGFGRSTGSGFPGESKGLLTRRSRWSDLERATFAFGYGLSVTPLQLARAYLVLANGGRLAPVTFLRIGARSRKPDGGAGVTKSVGFGGTPAPVGPPHVQCQPGWPGSAPSPAGALAGSQVLSGPVAALLNRMLQAVTAPGGTGHRAQVLGYRIAGKTGTARKSVRGGYAKDRYNAVFAGYAPASDPRVVVAVVVDEPQGRAYYGGQVAAPVFAEVVGAALRILGVPPDRPEMIARRVDLGRALFEPRSGPNRLREWPPGGPGQEARDENGNERGARG